MVTASIPPASAPATASTGGPPAAKAEPYFLQLDGVRAIAVILVLVQHWIANPRNMKAPFGFIGVTMFFVLSGYLISRILFRAREQLDQGTTIGAALRTFYMRRFLRIFPIYYVTIFVLYALGDPPVRASIGWLLSYTTNFYFMGVPGSDSRDSTGHLWSLAIEEQYYLLYPLFVMLLAARRRTRALWVIIGVSFVTRLALDLGGVSINANKFFTVSCFDSFALGGLLAQAEFEVGRERALAVFRSSKTLIAVVAFTVAFGVLGAVLGDARSLRVVWFRFVISVPSLYLVGVALLELRNNPLSRLLGSAPMRYIGKISYGVYLYHPYSHRMLAAISPIDEWSMAVRFVACSAATLAIASASWFLLEKPLTGLKKRFAY